MYIFYFFIFHFLYSWFLQFYFCCFADLRQPDHWACGFW